MNVVISQPRYLPALNYIQRMRYADQFILFDTVQRQSRGWENRNQLLLPDPKWLTIPIGSSNREMISKTQIVGVNWITEHKNTIHQFYKSTRHYDAEILEKYYDGIICIKSENGLINFSDAMYITLKNIGEILGLQFNLSKASVINSNCKAIGPGKLVEICKNLGATTYISGANGREYGVESAFYNTGIIVKFHTFAHPKYIQFIETRNFTPYMGFLDAIFNMGIEWVTDVANGELTLK